MMVGLKDVAQVAGVSVSTVSRVLTGSPLVNDETRARVQQAIDALDYRPNRVARRLRRDTARASLIGLIVPDIQNPFFAELVRGVESVAQRHGYMVFLGNSDEDAAKEKRYIDLMRSESVDGLLLPASSDIAETVSLLARQGLPIVCVDRRLPKATLDTVVADNVSGAHAAVDHLLRIGHRREKVEPLGLKRLPSRQGLGRGPTMTIAYLLKTGLTFDDAIAMVKKVRTFINPRKSQVEVLKQLQQHFIFYVSNFCQPFAS